MPHPYFVHQRSLKSWAWWRKEMGAEERCRKTTGKSKISLGWDQPGLPLLRACRMILQHLLNVGDGCLRTVPGAGTSWGHPWHQKTCSLPATHILQHQAVRSLCHVLCWTVLGFLLLLPLQSWHHYLSRRHPRWVLPLTSVFTISPWALTLPALASPLLYESKFPCFTDN